jgi:Mrp family chromosome partitioning ATPase
MTDPECAQYCSLTPPLYVHRADNLNDLRLLLDHVKDTEVLVLLQSKGVLTRPWVILELYTALTNKVPIVALNVANAFPYDYSAAMEFLVHFDEEIDIANPGAAELLVENGVDPVDVAFLLSDALPNIISTDFNPNGSSRQIQASLEDLADQMRLATPLAPTITKKEWLEKRKASSTRREAKQHGKGGAAAETAAPAELGKAAAPSPSRQLARVPKSVPELPTAYLVRETDIGGLKSAVMNPGDSTTALTSKQQKQQKVGAHGMGGVGKTTIAAALVNDEDVLAYFERVVWESLGQEPDIRECRSSIHFQLTDRELPETVTTDREIQAVIQNAAKDINVLLVLDDVWDPQHEKALNFIDPNNRSRLLVTTRIRGLLKNSAEVELGVLSQEDAVHLLLTSAEMEQEELDSKGDEHRIALELVELCGKLPLTLAIAGGMIAENGQGLTEDIVEALKESQDLEDEEGRTLEERVIASSLKMMSKGAGKNKELAEKMFHFFAVFPEVVKHSPRVIPHFSCCLRCFDRMSRSQLPFSTKWLQC